MPRPRFFWGSSAMAWPCSTATTRTSRGWPGTPPTGASRALLGFGRATDADVRLLSAQCDEQGSDVRADVEGKIVEYRVGVAGGHWVINSLCVLAAVRALGADVEAAAAALADLRPAKGRGERNRIDLPGGTFELIDDSYNASPPSMAAAFEVLGRARPGPGGRRIAVLGDMLELGDEAAACTPASPAR